MRRYLAAVALSLSLSAAERLPFWKLPASPDALMAEVDRHLEAAENAKKKLLEIPGTRTVQNTLLPYDEIFRHWMLGCSPAGVIGDTHPDPGFRKTALAAARKCSAAETDL